IFSEHHTGRPFLAWSPPMHRRRRRWLRERHRTRMPPSLRDGGCAFQPSQTSLWIKDRVNCLRLDHPRERTSRKKTRLAVKWENFLAKINPVTSQAVLRHRSPPAELGW